MTILIPDVVFGRFYTVDVKDGDVVIAQSILHGVSESGAITAAQAWLHTTGWLLFRTNVKSSDWDGFVFTLSNTSDPKPVLRLPAIGIMHDAFKVSRETALSRPSGSPLRDCFMHMLDDRDELLMTWAADDVASINIDDAFIERAFTPQRNRDRGLKAEKDEAFWKGGTVTKGSGCGKDKGDYRDPDGIYMVEFKTRVEPKLDPTWFPKLKREAAKQNLTPKLVLLSEGSRWEITVAKKQYKRVLDFSSLDLRNTTKVFVKIHDTVWVVERK